MRKTHLLSLAMFAALNALPSRSHAQFTFQGLGDLPGGGFNSEATGVSGNGTVVVGSGNINDNTGTAFRWTTATGMVDLGDLPGGITSSRGFGVSADGSTALGVGRSESGGLAFRWTSALGMVDIGDLPGGSVSSAARASTPNGDVIVGNGQGPLGTQAFRWDASNGMIGLGDLAGGLFQSIAYSVSSDGNIVVGYGNGVNGQEAFRWTASSGIQSLGMPNGFFRSAARGCSPDGGTILVNASTQFGSTYPFLWTQQGGFLPVGDQSYEGGTVNAVSGNGMVCGSYNSFAFIYSPSLGRVELKDYLEDRGVTNLGGWTLLNAYDVSDDGTTVVGYGTNPENEREAYCAVMPIDGTVFPTEVFLNAGYLLSAPLRALQFDDSGRFQVFPDEITLECSVELEGTSPFSTCSALEFRSDTSVARMALVETVKLFNYQSGKFDVIYGRIGTATDTPFFYSTNSNAQRYVSGSRKLRVNYTWAPLNDEAPAQDGWVHRIDVARWKVTE